MVLVKYNPRPEPGTSRCAGKRRKGTNTRASSSAGMPGPLSAIEKMQSSSRITQPILNAAFALVAELDGVGQQVVEHLAKPHPVAQHRRQSFADGQLDGLLIQQRPNPIDRFAHGRFTRRPRPVPGPGASDIVELEQLVDRFAHAKGPVASRFDQPSGFGRHLPAKLVERFVAQVGHRRQRGLQVVRRELGELPQFGVCPVEQIESVPQALRGLREIGLQRQADVQEYGLLQLQHLFGALADRFVERLGQVPHAELQILVVRPQKDLGADTDLGMRVAHAIPPDGIGFGPIGLEHRLQMQPLHLLEVGNHCRVLQESGSLLKGKQMAIEAFDKLLAAGLSISDIACSRSRSAGLIAKNANRSSRLRLISPGKMVGASRRVPSGRVFMEPPRGGWVEVGHARII